MMVGDEGPLCEECYLAVTAINLDPDLLCEDQDECKHMNGNVERR